MYTRLSTLACCGLIFLPALAQAQDSALHERINELESRLNQPQHSFASNLDISGVVELEAFSQNKLGDNDFDADLASIEVNIEAQVNPWTQAHVLLLHEAGSDQDLVVDEGFITLSFAESAIQVIAGKQVMPFGRFESNMISDPLTLEMAETKDSAIITRFGDDQLHASLYFFKGDVQKSSRNNTTTQMGANLGYAIDTGDLQLDFGLAYLSDLTETEGSLDALANDDGLTYPVGLIVTEDSLDTFVNYEGDVIVQRHVPSVALNTLVTAGNWHAIFEYIGATRSYRASDLAFDAKGAQPSSFNVEFSRDFSLAGKDLSVALAVQGTDQALGLQPTRQREMVSASYALQAQTSLTVEYMHASGYHPQHGSSDASADVISVQLAAEF